MDDEEVSKYAGLYAMADPTTAVAVAIAEHGGGTVNPSAVSATGDVGIWQINQRAHPKWSAEELKDPKTNAEAMSEVSSNGTNWQPWTTYRNGAYRAYLDRAKKARDATSGSGGLGSIPNPLDAVDDVAGAVVNLGETIAGFFEFITDPNTWKRIALVIAGGGIVLVGVAIVARGTEVGETVEAVATRGATTRGSNDGTNP
jgi:Lysozyme like domain